MSGRDRIAVCFDEDAIDTVFAEVAGSHLPGAAVGIAIGGHPVYRKGFGLASIELPVALSPTIRMRIGSVTKHMTALAFMVLCEDGKADLDDPVGKYFPEFHPASQAATFRQLMGNTSGLRDALDLCLSFSGFGRAATTNELVSLHRDISDVNAPPAKTWIYSNGGWQIVTSAIERISGQSFEDFLYERVFEPIGMYQSAVRRTDRHLLPNSASAHMTDLEGRFQRNDDLNIFTTELAGDGGVVSTVDDMLLWLRNMDKKLVGTEKSWQLITTSQRLTNGTPTHYGLGLVTGRYRGLDILYHAGGGTGTNAHLVTVPSAQVDVVCMVNNHNLSAEVFVSRILEHCFSQRPCPTRSVEGRTPAGVFRSPSTGRVVELRAETNAYWMKQEELRRGEVIASVDGMDAKFASHPDGVLRSFGLSAYGPQSITVVGDRSAPTAIRFDDYGTVDELVAIGSVGNPRIDSIFGTYEAQSVPVRATIEEKQVGIELATVGPFGSTSYTLEQLGEDVWRAASRALAHRVAILTFDATGFRYSNWHTRGLQFRRMR